jgi:ribonuclease R
MESDILELLGRSEYVPANVPGLLAALDWAPNRQQELQAFLQELETQGRVVRTKGNRYILADEADLVAGVIQITRSGKGFLLPSAAGVHEIMIPESATGTAMHGDRVLVRREVKPQGYSKVRPEETTGTVIRILERKRSTLVGTLQKGKQFLYVVPDDPRLPRDIFVPPPKDVGRRPNVGDKVVVEMVQWESRHTNPEGEIVEVLGPPDEEGVDMLSVLRHYDLPLRFPKEVLDEANTIAKSRPDNQPSPDEVTGRVDCREHLVVTIDPDDAKDFDDAICLKREGKDRWRLWVHIADVSHYVKPGGDLDKEARKRGNSTYLVDRVIPMLPEALSNELCSLKPGLDRLTKCVEFLLNPDGRVLETKFYPAVIHSKRRFTYREALAVIENGARKDDAIERMILDAHGMAQAIRRARFKAGSLDMDFPESKIRLDEHGKVIRIEKIDNDVSHQLIEEYMLLANEAVASRLMHLNRPAVYRVHESPKEKKLKDYREDVLAHKVECGNLTKRSEVQKLLELLGTLPIGAALKIGFLRSMMRARYAMEPLGHYGLNKAKYTHFTSPIRRYADLVVHRVLFENQAIPASRIQEIADHITATERNSSDAERDSKDVKLYAYLKAQIKSGKLVTYPGLVTDVRNFGFFVDVSDLGLSGMVHLSSVPDDFFTFDPVRARLVGRHSGRIIRLGDKLPVQVYRVDDFKKQVDFRMVSERPEGAREQEPVRDWQPDRGGRFRPGPKFGDRQDFGDRGKGKPAWDKNKRQGGPREIAPVAGQEKSKEESAKPFWQQRQDAKPGFKTKSNSGSKPNKGRRREKDRDWEIIKPEGKVSVKGPVKRKEGPTPQRSEPQQQAPQGKPKFGKKAKGKGTNQDVPKPTFRPEVASAAKPQPPPQFVRKDKIKPAPSAKPNEKSKGKPGRSSSKPSSPADSTKPTEKSKPGKVASRRPRHQG